MFALKRLLMALLMGAALVATGTLRAGDGDDLVHALHSLVNQGMARDGVPGMVIALVRPGQPVERLAFGLADPASGQPMTVDALFPVESLSKPVTAWGVMTLVEQGRIDLDAPAAHYLAGWPRAGELPSFTVRQLLTHTAGLALGDFAARYAPDAERPDLATFLQGDVQFSRAPGERFAYSDSGFNLLELIVERVSGDDFADYMDREVIDKLGMSTAGFRHPAGRMPVGHDLSGKPVPRYVYPARGSGGLYASAADMAAFLAAGVEGAEQSVLQARHVRLLQAPAVATQGLYAQVADNYALGYFSETLSDGQQAIWHGGQGYGWMSHFHMVPATGEGIVLLANSQRAWPLFARILASWSANIGVKPVGMSRVLVARKVAWAVLGLLAFLLIASVWRIARPRPVSPWRRRVQAAVALSLVASMLWAASQPYLFVSSVLPVLSVWLGGAMGLAGVTLLMATLRSGACKKPDTVLR
ncbi:MAG: serine hydrolase [Alcanivoracaceae bacterium]|nr:serine hydrolase [Alcanivoracaceae bacterium]